MAEALLSIAGRSALRWLAPAGDRSRLSILIFHRVVRRRDPLQPGEPTAEEFEHKLRLVKSCFSVLPLSDAVRRLASGDLPERPLSITFDDGYADNFEVALPVLRRLGLPATFFVAAGYLDGGRMFNDTIVEAIRHAPGPELDLSDLGFGVLRLGSETERLAAIGALLGAVKYLPQAERERRAEDVAQRCRACLPVDLMMRSEQVAALPCAGVEIGAHTVSHPILTEVDLPTARREIETGRQRLEQIIGAPVGLFAYPNGRPGRDYDARHVALVREAGFDAAVSTAWGVATRTSDRYQLPRFTPWDQRAAPFLARLWANLRQAKPVVVAA